MYHGSLSTHLYLRLAFIEKLFAGMQVLSYMQDNLRLARALASLCKHQHRAMQPKQPGQHCFCIPRYHVAFLFAATGKPNLWMSELRWPNNTASTLYCTA